MSISPGILQGGVAQRHHWFVLGHCRCLLVASSKARPAKHRGFSLARRPYWSRQQCAFVVAATKKSDCPGSGVFDWGPLAGSAILPRKRRKEETGESWRACWPHEKQAAAMTSQGLTAQRVKESGGGFLNPSQRRCFFLEQAK